MIPFPRNGIVCSPDVGFLCLLEFVNDASISPIWVLVVLDAHAVLVQGYRRHGRIEFAE